MAAERLVASQRNCVSLLLSLRSDWLKCPCNFRARVFGRPPVISGLWKRQVSLSESVRCSLLCLGHDDDDLEIVRYVAVVVGWITYLDESLVCSGALGSRDEAGYGDRYSVWRGPAGSEARWSDSETDYRRVAGLGD